MDTTLNKKNISYSTINAIGIILIGTFAGKLLGFFREMLIAKFFGASNITDAYLVATLIPFLVSNLIAGGALQVAFMPVLSDYIVNFSREEAFKVANNLLSITVLILSLIVLLLLPLTGMIVKFLGYGFDIPTQKLAQQLLFFTLPTLVLLNIINLFNAILNSIHHFTAPAFISVITNGSLITFMLIGISSLGIFSAVIGFSGGYIIVCIVLAGVLINKGYTYRFELNFKHPALKRILVLFLPIFFSTSFDQINLAVDRSMASGLIPGSISALNYGAVIVGILSSLSIAFAVAIFPNFNDLVNLQKKNELLDKLLTTLSLLFFIVTPIIMMIIALREPIVRLIFLRGAFDHTAEIMTTGALAGLAIGTPFYGGYYILLRAYYAFKDMRTPFVVALILVISHIIGNLIGIRFWGHVGIALSTSLMNILGMILLFYILYRRFSDFNVVDTIKIWGKILLGSLFSGGMAWILYTMGSTYLFHHSYIISLLFSIALALCIYYFIARLFHLTLIDQLSRYIKNLIFKKANLIDV